MILGDKEEILDAIGTFAEQVDQRFDAVDKRLDTMDGRIGKVESQMVTKSYLDDKLADLKGDMVLILRKEDQKVNRLVGFLAEKGTLTPTKTRDVLSFRPFP
jgi:hypothetical protein